MNLCHSLLFSTPSLLILKHQTHTRILGKSILLQDGTKTVTLTYFGTVDISHIVKKE